MTASRPANEHDVEMTRLRLEYKYRTARLKLIEEVLKEPWPFIRVALIIVLALGATVYLVTYLVSHVHLPDLVQSSVEGLGWLVAVGVGMAIPTIKTWLQKPLRKLTGKGGE
jgi:hypothetical protein